jgi:glutamate 5-kinase
MKDVTEKHFAERAKLFKSSRRIIIKLGTSTVSGADGVLSSERVAPIVEGIASLMAQGRQVVLVSSGAVGLGRGWLELHPLRLKDLVTKQACAAVGQSLLMHSYQQMFGARDVKIAQVLLTEGDFAIRQRYSNLRQTMEKLLGFGVLPIVNENDTVSTAEIEAVGPGKRSGAFSDNDRLAALVMSGLEADALVLLTNVDGLLRKTPKSDSESANAGESQEVLPLVTEITPELRALAAGPSAGGRGGMWTKLEAAEIAMNCGGLAVIANGQDPEIIQKLFRGEAAGTTFLPTGRIAGKRRWIAYAADVRGCVRVDAGTRKALTETKASLLASGVVRIESPFDRLDVVSIVDPSGKEFARGLANCSSVEFEKNSAGKSANRHADGPRNSRALVIRDNIVLLEKS